MARDVSEWWGESGAREQGRAVGPATRRRAAPPAPRWPPETNARWRRPAPRLSRRLLHARPRCPRGASLSGTHRVPCAVLAWRGRPRPFPPPAAPYRPRQDASPHRQGAPGVHRRRDVPTVPGDVCVASAMAWAVFRFGALPRGSRPDGSPARGLDTACCSFAFSARPRLALRREQRGPAPSSRWCRPPVTCSCAPRDRAPCHEDGRMADGGAALTDPTDPAPRQAPRSLLTTLRATGDTTRYVAAVLMTLHADESVRFPPHLASE